MIAGVRRLLGFSLILNQIDGQKWRFIVLPMNWKTYHALKKFVAPGIIAILMSVTVQHEGLATRPNVVFILADDLGYGDISCYGQNIIEILQGKSRQHGPVFTSHNEKIITMRDGDWKLYINKPNYLSSRDLNPDWVDPKAPNGTTIIAQSEQPSSMEYPGVVPKEFDNPTPLFNLRWDPVENVDLTRSHPEIASGMKEKYEKFLESLK